MKPVIVAIERMQAHRHIGPAIIQAHRASYFVPNRS